MARVPPDATAFPHRDKPVMLGIASMWLDTPAGQSEAGRHRAWTEALWRNLKPRSVGAYVNFMGDEAQESVRDAYPPATYRRLAEIKRRYDPTNLFRSNWNIPPSE
jgi:FAD/FMN-containing dehydrogenase